jgi:hypothetical protein
MRSVGCKLRDGKIGTLITRDIKIARGIKGHPGRLSQLRKQAGKDTARVKNLDRVVAITALVDLVVTRRGDPMPRLAVGQRGKSESERNNKQTGTPDWAPKKNGIASINIFQTDSMKIETLGCWTWEMKMVDDGKEALVLSI